MYEQAQPVRALIVSPSDGQAEGEARSPCTLVRQSSARWPIPHDNGAPYNKRQECPESSSDTYEEPEAVRLQIAKLSPPKHASGAQQTTPEAKSPQEEADVTIGTPRHVDPSADMTHRDGPGDRRGLFSFLRAHHRCMTAAFVVAVALVTTGLVLAVVFINKTSQLSTTADALKRSLANERNRTAVLGQRLKTSVSRPGEYIKRSGTSASCPEGYTEWRGVCYKAFNTRKNFWQSDNACHDDAGTLAMPRDADTNAFLISLYKVVNDSAPFWFGLHDEDEEGTFKWVDSTALGKYNSWATGQPNNYRGWEDCIRYSASKLNATHWYPNIIRQAEKWYDTACSARIPFLCQVILTAGH
ncbi:COLEC11 [Branchiostoma lanceolatum]|uniref:COLEC11 protein n=1 Tax=Branchiostoma lanceolatum TaxID=7740 RepID=A0A8K0A200_BRALA|nr:COLEC11 [Branchiostoma lanceolatum]